MPKQVRVKDPETGVEFTTNEIHAEAAGLEVIDKPATDDFGRDLPVKYRTNLAGEPVDETPAVPAASATRDELEAYAVEHGGMTEEAAQAFANKGELHAALTTSKEN